VNKPATVEQDPSGTQAATAEDPPGLAARSQGMPASSLKKDWAGQLYPFSSYLTGEIGFEVNEPKARYGKKGKKETVKTGIPKHDNGHTNPPEKRRASLKPAT